MNKVRIHLLCLIAKLFYTWKGPKLHNYRKIVYLATLPSRGYVPAKTDRHEWYFFQVKHARWTFLFPAVLVERPRCPELRAWIAEERCALLTTASPVNFRSQCSAPRKEIIEVAAKWALGISCAFFHADRSANFLARTENDRLRKSDPAGIPWQRIMTSRVDFNEFRSCQVRDNCFVSSNIAGTFSTCCWATSRVELNRTEGVFGFHGKRV